MRFPFWALCASAMMLFLFSCKDEDNSYETPTDYHGFDNVSYQGQLDRLDMLGEMKSYINSARDGEALDAGRLAAMYSNETSIANWEGTYGGKQLRNKTASDMQTKFDALLNAAASDSQNGGGTSPAGNGQAGLLTSLDGAKEYYVNANGVEYAQIIEKGLMSACFAYQQTGVYLESGKMDVDNTTVEAGEGTEMEHHWDESFGYFGVPKDFPANTDGVRFWGSYCNDRNELLGTNRAIMDAYLKGRAAISNNDLSTRDEQIKIIQEKMDEVAVGTTIHYINSALSNFNDPARRAHSLSEAVAFYSSTYYNPSSKTSQSAADSVMAQIGGSTDFSTMDFWSVTEADLEAARTAIRETYGWDASLAEQL